MKIEDLEQLGLNEGHLAKFEKFREILKEWGKVHNLSAELEDEKIDKNIMDSIYPLTFVDFSNVKTLADIGTGAGYPGLILSIVKSDIKFYLIEPRGKRVAFLNFLKNILNLSNVEILCNRVENVQDLKVDMITSRAVTNTSLLMDITSNITQENTSFLFYKGSMLESELEDAKIKNYQVINKDDKRNYLYINKR